MTVDVTRTKRVGSQEEWSTNSRAALVGMQREQILCDILDHTTAVVYLKGLDGRYILVNRRFEELFNVSRTEVVGKTDFDIFPEAAARKFRENDQQVIEFRAPLELEEIVPQADGPHVYISLKYPIYDKSGELYGVCGISTDVTNRKRTEDETRRHIAELAHAVRLGSMGELAAGLAHELNQPLCALLSNAQAMLRMLDAPGSDAAMLRGALEDVVCDAKRAADIVRGMRAFLRKEVPRRCLVDVNGVVCEAVKFIEVDARRQKSRVRLCLGESLPPVEADRVQIQQVILNLAGNALHAMEASAPDARELVISTAASDGDGIRVCARDRGPGLPPDAIARLFEPFFTTKAGGMGLGLAVCRSIIEAHDGKIWAEPNHDGGMMFAFELPRARDTAHGAV